MIATIESTLDVLERASAKVLQEAHRLAEASAEEATEAWNSLEAALAVERLAVHNFVMVKYAGIEGLR